MPWWRLLGSRADQGEDGILLGKLLTERLDDGFRIVDRHLIESRLEKSVPRPRESMISAPNAQPPDGFGEGLPWK